MRQTAPTLNDWYRLIGYKPISQVNGFEPCRACDRILEAHDSDTEAPGGWCQTWRP